MTSGREGGPTLLDAESDADAFDAIPAVCGSRGQEVPPVKRLSHGDQRFVGMRVWARPAEAPPGTGVAAQVELMVRLARTNLRSGLREVMA